MKTLLSLLTGFAIGSTMFFAQGVSASIFDQFPGFRPVLCPGGTQSCPDGSTVQRDPDLNCAFPACPVEEVTCGNNICETGEADQPGEPCRFSSPTFCARLPNTAKPGTCPSDCDGGDQNSDQQCAHYIRNNQPTEYCAVCGDNICDNIEQCTSSSCSGTICTDDCGDLHCPQDCDPNYQEPSDNDPDPADVDPQPVPQPVTLCVDVRRDNKNTQICAPCGNGICEEVEGAGVPSLCFRSLCFFNHVKTECPQDCAL